MKKVFFILIIIVSLIIIKNLSSSIYTLWHKQDLVKEEVRQLEMEKKKNQALKKQLSQIESPGFVEEQARDKLFMVKPGEEEIIIPDGLLGTNRFVKRAEADKTPNWQKWLDLFF